MDGIAMLAIVGLLFAGSLVISGLFRGPLEARKVARAEADRLATGCSAWVYRESHHKLIRCGRSCEDGGWCYEHEDEARRSAATRYPDAVREERTLVLERAQADSREGVKWALIIAGGIAALLVFGQVAG